MYSQAARCIGVPRDDEFYPHLPAMWIVRCSCERWVTVSLLLTLCRWMVHRAPAVVISSGVNNLFSYLVMWLLTALDLLCFFSFNICESKKRRLGTFSLMENRILRAAFVTYITYNKLEVPLRVIDALSKENDLHRRSRTFSLFFGSKQKMHKRAFSLWRSVVRLLVYRPIKSPVVSCVWARPARKPPLAPSAVREISSILRYFYLDIADLCGPAPCALGLGWMDTRRALFPETDEFAKWKFW